MTEESKIKKYKRSSLAAAAFIGSATFLAVLVLDAAATSTSVKDFCDKGSWETVIGTATSAISAGAGAYVSTRGNTSLKAKASQSVADAKPFLPDSFYSKHAPKQSVPYSSYTIYSY